MVSKGYDYQHNATKQSNRNRIQVARKSSKFAILLEQIPYGINQLDEQRYLYLVNLKYTLKYLNVKSTTSSSAWWSIKKLCFEKK